MGANEKHDATYHGSAGQGAEYTQEDLTGKNGLEREIAADNYFKPSQASATAEAGAPKAAPVGPVARWVMGVVALAIVTPFIGILWAWAADVVRSFG